MSTENNGLREELLALKASKGVIESEVKALRDEVMALNVIKERDAKDVRLGLSQSLVSLKETNERIESQFKVLTQQMMALETRFGSDFMLKFYF
jgi:hypothetical protein